MSENLAEHKLRRIGSSYNEYQAVEVTSAGSAQELVAGVSGQNIVLIRFNFTTTAATVMNLEYNGTLVTAKYQLGSNGSAGWDNRRYIVLPDGEGLDVLCTIDPNTGWIEIEYDIVNFSGSTGNTY